MNEPRDILIGIDFGETKSQICYYDRKENEPVSISMKMGGCLYEAPTCLCKHVHNKGWSFGMEAEYFAREYGGILVENLYRITGDYQKVSVGDEDKAPFELAALFLKELLKIAGFLEAKKNIKCLIITTPKLTKERVDNLKTACESLGFQIGQYLLMDYSESFYYYALSQRPDTWNRHVGWYEFQNNQVSFRKLTMDITVKPTLVRLQEPISASLSTDAPSRDIDFYQFIQRTIGNDLYSSVLITGSGFDQEWAEKSTPLLCKQQRKVLQGNNLFAKGACYGAKEKLEDKKLKNYLYAGDALVKTNVGMELFIMGSMAYYPLIEAGNNWYECSTSCEILLDGPDELVFIVSEMGSKEKNKISMALPGLPKRPRKATRLSLALTYQSEKDCVIIVKDMGFGDFFPSSQKVWKETVQW